MNPDELLLPPGSRLVHIGLPKTGTTSLQRALHTGRGSLRRHGVHFAGPTAHPRLAARAVAGAGRINGERPPRPEDWTDLVDEVRGAGDQRVVISSEILSAADEAGARRVVTELAGGPVHVVVTLRSLAKIAPSQWQQSVQDAGVRLPYAKWLEKTFRPSPHDIPTPLSWRRNAHGELVRRWAEVAGRENLTVVVADEADPDMLLRTFEGFVGLPAGLLVPTANYANRSLTRGEIELVRLINQHFYEHGWSGPWSQDVHARVVRSGLVRRMKTGRRPARDEPRLAMPDWVVERVAEAAAESVETIKSLGVRVVGDLAKLTEVPADRRADQAGLTGPALVPADAAALAVLGAIEAGGHQRRGAEAAALAVVGAINVSGNQVGQAGMPLIRPRAAARAVLGAIEAGGKQAGPAEPADTRTATGLAAVRPVFDALDLRLSIRKAAKPRAERQVRVARRAIQELSTPDLLRAVARRGRRRLRRSPYAPSA